MGMDAQVLAIGPWGAFRGDDLDYAPETYQDSIETGDERIICCVAWASTSQQSRDLAAICCVNPWALGKHEVKRIDLPSSLLPGDWIGDIRVGQVVAKLQRLLDAGCELWYRPNG